MTAYHSPALWRFDPATHELEAANCIDLTDNASLWLARASLDHSDDRPMRQSLAVRQLLSHYLPAGVALAEQAFPYRLVPVGWPVCFSHSGTEVALLVGPMARVALDLERGAISTALAERAFSPTEAGSLHGLQEPEAQRIRKRLWMLKECEIKLFGGQLFTGLRANTVAQWGESVVAPQAHSWSRAGIYACHVDESLLIAWATKNDP